MAGRMLFANYYEVWSRFVLSEFLLVFLAHFDPVNLSWLMTLTRQSRMWLCGECLLSFSHLARLRWIYFVTFINHYIRRFCLFLLLFIWSGWRIFIHSHCSMICSHSVVLLRSCNSRRGLWFLLWMCCSFSNISAVTLLEEMVECCVIFRFCCYWVFFCFLKDSTFDKILIFLFIEKERLIDKQFFTIGRIVMRLLDLILAITKAANFCCVNFLCFLSFRSCYASTCSVSHE